MHFLNKKMAVFLNLRLYGKDGAITADEQYIRFWVALAESFSHVTICAPFQTNGTGHHEIAYNPRKVSFCPLPMYRSSFDLYSRFPSIAMRALAACGKAIGTADVFVAVVPNLLGLCLGYRARKQNVPCAYYVRGNLERTVRFEYRNSKFRTIPRTIASCLERLARRRMRESLTFVVGKELYDKYSSIGIGVTPIITSLISEASIRPSRTLGGPKQPFHLLNVGRLSPERGIDTLLKALVILRETSRVPFKCTLVGDGPERQMLEETATSLSLDNVEFAGYIPFGPDLLSIFESADLFVLPSHTEGFPKVIIEAMASSIPVVATRVGGIPFVLTSGFDSMLVPPNNPAALAEAIEKVATDIGFYNRIAANSLETVKGLTFERQRDIFVAHMHDYLCASPSR